MLLCDFGGSYHYLFLQPHFLLGPHSLISACLFESPPYLAWGPGSPPSGVLLLTCSGGEGHKEPRVCFEAEGGRFAVCFQILSVYLSCFGWRLKEIRGKLKPRSLQAASPHPVGSATVLFLCMFEDEVEGSQKHTGEILQLSELPPQGILDMSFPPGFPFCKKRTFHRPTLPNWWLSNPW